MRKVTVKKMKDKSGVDPAELSEMFNQMLGTGNTNLVVAYPRYLRMEGLCRSLINVFEAMAECSYLSQPDLIEHKTEIVTFCEGTNRAMAELFALKYPQHEWNMDSLPESDKAAFSELYASMKKSDLINMFVVICGNLARYHVHFKTLETLNPRFVYKMPGVEWFPFPFTSLNLKYVFTSEMDDPTISDFFMTIFWKVHGLTRTLYGETQSPDIDVAKFASIILENIEKLQSIPELHRCNRAFAKIKESINLLETNFTGYYKDFLETNDSTIMMTNFISDVSNNTTNGSAQMALEFKKIIMYYRNLSASHNINPEAKKMLDRVNETLNMFDNPSPKVHIRDDPHLAQDETISSSISGEESNNEVAPKTKDELAREAFASKTVDELMDFIDGPPTPSRQNKASAGANPGSSRGGGRGGGVKITKKRGK